MRILTSFFPILMLGPRAHASDVPELPSRDPFYTPKASNWTDEKVGTILDSRRVTIDLPILPGGEIEFEAFQLLYVTQDLHQDKATSVTTIIVPQGANTSRILSFQIAYDAPDINCSPSYGLQKDANKAAAGWSLNQMIFVAEALSDAGSPVLNRVGRREDTPHGLGGPSAATVSVLDI
ncbi:hypothetical protein KXW42_008043 [Aspergillus fumigatus]|nr:hypothetical protein KXX34_003452 [Aspergillus fumigatus]KAH1693782.1 hypothetical protein KXX12_007927 [Aspergillus fumigatus]KAH1708549.1 hypothetical protein KXX24_001284 [Aspergillus fumigatus]KAH1942354.1 hypothetical protein KXV59_001007 [Aspergillus fumigatus]KAH2682787.1 hypothetical protein KXW53_003125 [Aspergillus fumigatus]